MNCTQTQNMLDDYLDGSLSSIQLDHTQAHLNDCASCRHSYEQAQSLAHALKDIPVPSAKVDYEERMLQFLDQKPVTRQTNPIYKHNWWITGFTSTIAATLTLWLAFSPVSILFNTDKNFTTVNLLAQKKQTIDLVFNLTSKLTKATLTLELPEKVEISGYPGQKQLSWTTSFKKGANRLALPIIGSEEQSGILIARLTKEGTTKIFRIRINTKKAPTSSLILTNPNKTAV